MATAIKPAAGTLKYLPLAEIKAESNVRQKLGDLAELTESIKIFGVLQPLTVRPQNGHYVLVAGYRRHAAAKAARLIDVPCLIREDLVDANFTAAQLIENLQRVDLDPLEEGDGYRKLVDLGLKQSEIARKVSRSEAHISKRLALAGLSPLAAKHLAVGTIPLDAAVQLAKHAHEHQDRAIKDVEGNYKTLDNAAPYQLRELGRRASDEAKKDARKKKRAELIKKLKADGVTVLPAGHSYDWGQPGHPWRVGPGGGPYYRGGRVDMSAKKHAEFPCHAAAVTSPGSIYSAEEPTVAYLCTDPTSHMSKDEAAKFKKKASENDRDRFDEQRRRRDAVHKEIRDAQEERLPFIREQLKSMDQQVLAKMALEYVINESGGESLAKVLGLEAKKGGNTVVAYCNASHANLVRAAAAVAILHGQRAILALAESQAGGFYFDRPDEPHALNTAEWFQLARISLTEVELKALEKATKK